MIKAVIFDLDNTLYDYDACNATAEKRLFEVMDLDLDVSRQRCVELLKCAKEDIKRKLGDGVAASHNRLLYMQNICEQEGKNPFLYAMKFYNVYWDTMLENMKLFNYVEPLIGELKKREIKIGILTDLTSHIQYRKIVSLGLSEKIDYFVTSEEAGAEKPSEKMFLLMLEKMQLDSSQVLMIGDSYKKDIIGAEHVGMKALHYDGDLDFIEKVIAVLE